MPYNKWGQRKWLSLYEYKRLYPDEEIEYEKPDFREKENTCKWCGKEIQGKRKKSYCSEDCRRSFHNVTTWNRGHSALAYKILCRDKFFCRKCGQFIGLVNEHGMMIPVGVGAEVHHIELVSKGGSDNQSNLISTCHDCHVEEHRKINERGEG